MSRPSGLAPAMITKRTICPPERSRRNTRRAISRSRVTMRMAQTQSTTRPPRLGRIPTMLAARATVSVPRSEAFTTRRNSSMRRPMKRVLYSRWLAKMASQPGVMRIEVHHSCLAAWSAPRSHRLTSTAAAVVKVTTASASAAMSSALGRHGDPVRGALARRTAVGAGATGTGSATVSLADRSGIITERSGRRNHGHIGSRTGCSTHPCWVAAGDLSVEAGENFGNVSELFAHGAC